MHGHEGRLRPGGESNLFDLADSNTCVEVIAGVPLGLGISDVSLDLILAVKSGSQDLNLPVWVFPGSSDSVLVEVVLIHDGLVFWVVLAGLDVNLDLRNEFFDSGLNS